MVGNVSKQQAIWLPNDHLIINKLQNILSIMVAVCDVILDGRVIKGKNICEYISSKNFPVVLRV